MVSSSASQNRIAKKVKRLCFLATPITCFVRVSYALAVAVLSKKRSENSKSVRQPSPPGLTASRLDSSRMPERIYVRLTRDSYFFCPYCKRFSPHPPRGIFLEYYVIGYGFCSFCSSWFPIEGGDGCGIVKVDEDGEFYTLLPSGKKVVKGRLVDGK
jgi:hypothetical protein